MKSMIVFAVLVAAAVAAPAGPEAAARIVDQKLENIGVDGYGFKYETENGIAVKEEGAIQDAGTENEGIEVVGSFRYLGPDNVIYEVNYRAGRNGFVPEAAHIPKGPVV